MVSFGSVLFLLVALILGITVTVSLGDTGSRIGPCKYQFNENGTVIDLNPLASHDGSNWKFNAAGSSSFLYYFSPCWPMNELKSGATECGGAVACQEYHEGSNIDFFNIGTPDTEGFTMDGTNVIVSYSGTTGGKKRTSKITLICDRENATQFNFISQTQPPSSLTYTFSLRAKECCPIHEGGISFGSILCIIFVVILVVYIVGGILFNKFARGATGAELIPNHAFWVDLPTLIKEGFQFTASKISGCFSRDSQYDQI